MAVGFDNRMDKASILGWLTSGTGNVVNDRYRQGQ
jgi:hypothetical protein